MLSQNREKEFLDRCETRLAEYEQGKDIVVINGWRNGGFSINSALAKHMAAPMLLAMDYLPGETPSACYDRAVRCPRPPCCYAPGLCRPRATCGHPQF